MKKNPMAALLMTVVAALATSASWPASAADADRDAAAQACGTILKLSPSSNDFQACTASLSESVARVAYFKALAAAQLAAARACGEQGQGPATAAYPLCLYDHLEPTVSVEAISQGEN